MIAMTMATIGRRMKKFAMALAALGFLVPARGPPGGAGGAAPGSSTFTISGFTLIPVRTFWSPSTTIRSPALRPESMTQSVPIRSPGFTMRISTVSSLPTTATL